MSAAPSKPLPVPSTESEPFWSAVREHELRLQRCQLCHQFWFPPSSVCTECLSEKWDWKRASGRGTIFSFIVMHRAYHPGFRADLPYNVAVIELEEGPRLVSNVVDCPNEALAVGQAVDVVFDDVAENVTLAKFRLAPPAVN